MVAALQLDCGNFVTRTTNGTQTINCVDQDGNAFTPKAVILLGVEQASPGSFTAHGIMSHGFATATTERFASAASVKDAVTVSTIAKRRQTASSFLLIIDQDGNVDIAADLNAAFSGNSFVLNYTTTDGIAYQVNYLAIGGSAVTSAKVVNFQSGVSLGDVAITSVGFKPNCVLFISAAHTALDSTTDNASLMFGFQGPDVGFGSGRAGAVSMVAQAFVGTSNTGRVLRDHACIQYTSIKSGVPGDAGYAFVKSYDTNGFTLTFGTAPAASYYTGCLALIIEGSKASFHTAPNSITTQDGPSLSFTPRGVIFLSHSAALNSFGTGPADTAAYSVCWMTSATKRGTVWFGAKDNVTTTEADQLIQQNKALIMASHGAPTADKQANFSAMAATWQLSFDVADGSSRDYVALTLGETLIVTDGGERRRMLGIVI